MNFKALDDPALLLPRVMNVHGAFNGLGFVWHFYKGVEYAICHVQLFHPVEAQFVRRAISHVGFVISLAHGELTAQMRFGYPVNVHRGTKVVHTFKDLASKDSTYWHLGDDRWLREVEGVFKALFENLRTKAIQRTVLENGDEWIMPGYEAVRYAVRQGLITKDKVTFFSVPHRTDDLFSELEDPVQVESRVVPVNKYCRLPNFDKSTRPRLRQSGSHRRGY